MDYKKLSAEARKDTIIHYLKAIRKLKNPENIVVIDEEKCLYSHTNTRGKTTYYKLFGSFQEYHKSEFYNTELKYFSCNGFWIVVIDDINQLYALDK